MLLDNRNENPASLKRYAVDNIGTKKSCKVEEIKVEEIDEATHQCKQKNTHMNEPCKKCEKIKEMHSHLLREFKGFIDYCMNARGTEVVKFEKKILLQ